MRQSIAYAESAERAVPIFEYRPDLGVDYLLVAEELLTRLGFTGQAARIAAMIPAPAEPAPEVPADPAPETPREPEAPAAVNGHAAAAAPAEGAFRFRAR